MKKALIIMTRVPISRQTKTRLMDILTGDECADIHFCFLKDIFNMCKVIKDDIDIYLTYTPCDKFYLMKDIVPDYITSFAQVGENLGEKMKNSINFLLDKRYDKVLLMGCDIPQIKASNIYDGFKVLDFKDLVLGPTFDGGYYLIGMKKSNDIVFDKDIKWGNKSVLEGTIEICSDNNIDIGIGEKLVDIDTKEDIKILFDLIESKSSKKMPINTYNFIINLLEQNI